MEEKRTLVVEMDVEGRRWVGMRFHARDGLQATRDEDVGLRVLGEELSG